MFFLAAKLMATPYLGKNLFEMMSSLVYILLFNIQGVNDPYQVQGCKG